MDFLKYIKRGRARHCEPKPLRIEGVKTVMTPEPDDTELAAQALLESLGSEKRKVKAASKREKSGKPEKGTPEYYRQLSDRIRTAREQEARLALRFVAWCEAELKTGTTPPSELESELYHRIDIIDREGGELKKRWQHCLAEVIVRQTVNNSPDKT